MYVRGAGRWDRDMKVARHPAKYVKLGDIILVVELTRGGATCGTRESWGGGDGDGVGERGGGRTGESGGEGGDLWPLLFADG